MSDADALATFYRRLVDLAQCREPVPLLDRALGALVELTGADEGYIEIQDGDRAWRASRGCRPDRVGEIRDSISRGIIAEALATGETIVTASAVVDPRFRDRESVRRKGIDAVVCGPLGEQPRGVVYLQGGGLAVNAEQTYLHVEYFGRAIAPFAEHLLDQGRPAAHGPFEGVVAQSSAMKVVTKRLAMVAPLDVHVLLTGPTGVGKSLVARSIHLASRRSNSSYYEINCAAIPDALLESELFGAAKGAHSAVADRGIPGKVEAAEGGTLFLDEIAELAVGSQAKLLQLLQDGVYYRLGDTSARQSNVRIIAATNVDLGEAIAAKTFREDLYYRLSVVETAIPPLCEREEDILPLARHFLRHACDRFDLPPKRLSKEAQRALIGAQWPGNVRQLRHRIESAALDAHLDDENRPVTEVDIFGDQDRVQSSAEGWREVTRQFQRRHLLGVLETSEWNISEVASRLGIARSHVYNLMHEHELSRSRVAAGG